MQSHNTVGSPDAGIDRLRRRDSDLAHSPLTDRWVSFEKQRRVIFPKRQAHAAKLVKLWRISIVSANRPKVV